MDNIILKKKKKKSSYDFEKNTKFFERNEITIRTCKMKRKYQNKLKNLSIFSKKNNKIRKQEKKER